VATGAPYDRSVTTLRVRPLLGARVRPGLRAPVVVAIVLGILGMHGISAHGADLHGSLTRADSATPAAAVMADPEPVAVHNADAHSAGGASSSEAAGHPAGHSDGTEGMGGTVMMCVAMLAGAAVALLTLLVRRGRLPAVWAILGPAGRFRVAVPAVLRLGTGPPAVWRFSVIRC
jgi:hypothetical protein